MMTQSKTMTQATSGKYADRIAAGAAFLDKRAPGWRQRINLDKLELSSCAQCVLGQLDGRGEFLWSNIVRRFGLDYVTDQDVELGLALDGDDDSYEDLTAEWKQYIEATR